MVISVDVDVGRELSSKDVGECLGWPIRLAEARRVFGVTPLVALHPQLVLAVGAYPPDLGILDRQQGRRVPNVLQVLGWHLAQEGFVFGIARQGYAPVVHHVRCQILRGQIGTYHAAQLLGLSLDWDIDQRYARRPIIGLVRMYAAEVMQIRELL